MKKVSLAVMLTLLLGACSTLGYYSQAVTGQLYILTHRQKIDRLIADPATDPQLKSRLGEVAAIRRFADTELGLPVASHYSTYVDLQRQFVVWNVFATPEFSMEPQRWCYPVAGCVSYRGYFNEGDARAYADKLRNEGKDVYVGGIAAYSTLGWFSDSVLNTILKRKEHQLAALVFHELAHQIAYIPGDTVFNESFAMTVEREGQRRWLQANTSGTGELAELQAGIRTEQERQAQFVSLVTRAAADLRALYDDASIGDKRAAKEQRYQRMRDDYAALKIQWGGYNGYDAWFASDLNNAKLGTVTTYNSLVPAFTALLARHNGDLRAFYAEVKALEKLDAGARHAFLQALVSGS